MDRVKLLTAISLSLLLLACSGGGDGTAVGELSSDAAYVRVSPRDSRYFELTDRTPFVPIGLNIAFPRFLTQEEEVFQKMDERIQKLAANGGNLIRIWMSHPFYDIEHEYSAKFDTRKISRIDRIIGMARRHGVRVKLTFDHFRTFDEVPPKFAGGVGMGKPIYHVSRGGPAKNMTEFFTLDKAKERYKRKFAWFAKRYKDEPTVFAWELWNEIDAADGSGWVEWTREMLAEVHAQFPNQMAVQSLGSLDHFRKRMLFTPVWKMEGNDFAQVHRYLDQGAALAACKGPVDVMAADAIRMVRSAGVTDRPIILAETGAVEPGHAGASNLYENDRVGTILHDVLFAPFFAGSAGTGQIWHWNTYVERHDLWHHFGHFAEMLKGIDPPAEQFVPGMVEHEQMRVYTLRGNKTSLAWCRDKAADWHAELERVRVRPLSGALLDFNGVPGGLPAGRVRILNPWTGEWTDAQADDGKIELPSFLRSVVVRIDG
jgi:cellulase (glycosyl hydrolase family 5)